LFGFLVFHQFPGLSTWFGAAIVVAAAIFMIYRETRRKRGWTDTPGASDTG
jgi:drug/metabolite transporter (DMT)-like permease